MRWSELALFIFLLAAPATAREATAPTGSVRPAQSPATALPLSVSVLPPPKCFASETSRSAEDGTCLILSRSAYEEIISSTNITDRADVTCGVDTTIPDTKLGSCPDAQAALDAHNAARARWGAPPLLWSKTLADYAQTVSNTCVFAHSNGPYGENLAIGSGLSCKSSLDLWMGEEKNWVPGGGFSSSTGHFTQVVWKSTSQVGCALKSCNGRNFITCSYNPPGNVIGQFNSQVGSQGQAPDCAAPTTPISSSPPPPPTFMTVPKAPPSPSPKQSPPMPVPPKSPSPPPPFPPSSTVSPPRPPPPVSNNFFWGRCCFTSFICFPCYTNGSFSYGEVQKP